MRVDDGRRYRQSCERPRVLGVYSSLGFPNRTNCFTPYKPLAPRLWFGLLTYIKSSAALHRARLPGTYRSPLYFQEISRGSGKTITMKYTLLGLAVVAGATAQPQFTNIPSNIASFIPSSVRSFIPSGVLPTPAASSNAASTDSAAGSQTTDPPFIPPPFSTNPGAWSSIYRSIESEGFSWPSSAYGPGQGPWGPNNHPWGPPGGGRWGGPGGWGPWGSDGWGPSVWQSNSAWRNGPWTQWWGGSVCPGSDWPGWTQGPWSTDAPWTSWAGCTASTTSTSVITTTISGVRTTATQYGVQVAQAAGTGGSSGSATSSVGSQGAAPVKTMAPALAAIGGAVAIFL